MDNNMKMEEKEDLVEVEVEVEDFIISLSPSFCSVCQHSMPLRKD